jgi:predicted N-acyltransferase
MGIRTDFDVQIAHSAAEIGQEAWDGLAGDRPFASYRWYQFGEAVLADNVPVYIVLSLAGERVALATFWLRRREQLPISSRATRWLIESILRRRPLLTCRSPMVESAGLILPEEPELRAAALDAIAWIALEQARQHGASFLMSDFLEKHEVEHAGWPSAFVPFEMADPGTRLHVEWDDFDSYVAHLHKSQRRHYRQETRRAREMNLEITRHRQVDRVDEAVALSRNVERKHGSPPYPWMRQMFERVDMIDGVWLAAEIDGRLVGSELLLRDQGTWCAKGLGLDYDVSDVYFVLGYANIRCAIEEGALSLRWGSGAYHTKKRLGFQLESNNHAVFASTSHLLQAIARRVISTEKGLEEEGA